MVASGFRVGIDDKGKAVKRKIRIGTIGNVEKPIKKGFLVGFCFFLSLTLPLVRCRKF